MFQLLNGNLLITQVNESDNQTYKWVNNWQYETSNQNDPCYRRCTIQNTYYHTKPVRTFATSLQVVNAIESQMKSGTILPLWTSDNTTIEIGTGDILKMMCVAYSEEVRWSFRHRNDTQPFRINNNNHTSNILVFRNVSYAAHDGFYNCSTTTDFLVNFPPTNTSQNRIVESEPIFYCRFTMLPLAYRPS